MVKRSKDPDEWETVGIKHGRLNGLKLERAKQNRTSPANTLDTILQEAGVKSLTDEKLETELAKIGKIPEATAS